MLAQWVAEGSIACAGERAGSLRANVQGEKLILGGDIILRVNEVPVETLGATMRFLEASAGSSQETFSDHDFSGRIVTLSIPTSP